MRLWIALLLMVTFASATFAEVDMYAARVESGVGVATLWRGGHSSRLKVGTVLKSGDRVKVDKGTVLLRWPDGSMARLEPGTDVGLSETQPGALTHATIYGGSMWLNVLRYSRRPGRFEVQTNHSLGSVEGTKVLFQYDAKEDRSNLQVFAGKVQCTYLDKRCELIETGTSHVHNQRAGSMDDKAFRAPWSGP